MVVHLSSRFFSDKHHPRRRQIYQGSEKILFEGTEAGTHVLYFTDEFFQKDSSPIVLTGKGVINNRLSELLLTRLSSLGINHHFIKRLNMREHLIRAVEVLPVRLTLYNYATDYLSKRFSIDKGGQLQRPLYEFTLRDPRNPHVVSKEHIYTFNLAQEHECDEMQVIAQRVSDFLSGQFIAMNYRLASVSLEFGRSLNAEMDMSDLIVVDEISLDTCELIDEQSGQFLGRSSMEEGLETLAKAYQKIADRFGILHNNNLKLAE